MNYQSKLKLSDEVLSEFRHWDPELKELVLSESAIKKYKDEQVIYLEGDISSHLYLVVSGEVKVSSFDQAGHEKVFDLLKFGEIFGEVGVIDNLPRESAAISSGSSSVLAIPKKTFLTSLHSADFKAWLDLMKLLCSRRRGLYKKSNLLATDTTIKRVASKLLDLCDKDNPVIKIRQEDLAAFVDADRSIVSRSLGELEKLGYLKKARGYIVIDKKEDLIRYMEKK